MTDDVLINKAMIVKRCIERIHSEYDGFESEFLTNMAKQDSVVLNIQRTCEACIDMGVRYIRIHQFRIPENSRDVFKVLVEQKSIPENLGFSLQAMVGFRNIAVHDYQKLDLDIVKKIISERLQEMLQFSAQLLYP